MKIDETDRRILKVLQKSGRISNSDLADKINLSASACHRRVQRLEDDGIIKDYVALLDPRKIDRKSTVFVEITLSGQADAILEAFEKSVALVPDVLECHLMAGTADYMLKVVAGDTDDFARIHRQYLVRGFLMLVKCKVALLYVLYLKQMQCLFKITLQFFGFKMKMLHTF